MSASPPALVLPRPGPALRNARLRQLARWGLAAPALALVAVFLVLPYINIVFMSLRPPGTGAPHGAGFTLANYAGLLRDGYFAEVLADTLTLGISTSAICLLLGYPLAYHLARTNSRFQSLLYVLVLSPLLVGVIVRSFAWLVLLSGNGVVNQALLELGLIDKALQLMNNRLGVTIALVHVFLPMMVLALLANIQSIDPGIEAAARSLGAGWCKTFCRVTLPLSLPGIQAGTTLVFILAISAYATPSMLGGTSMTTLSVLIVQNLLEQMRWPFGAALAFVLTLAGLAVVVLYACLLRRAMRGVH